MAKRPSPDSVICIDLTEDDDECEKNLEDVRKRLKSSANIKSEGSRRSNNDDDGGGKIGSVASLQQQEWASEVEVIEPVAPQIHAVASAQAASTNDDDIVLVGTANESRLPHMRQHCPDNKFVQDIVSSSGRQYAIGASKRSELQEGKTGNISHCDLCFCYVCDKPAKECTSWSSTGTATYASHCHASDTGVDARTWKNHRTAAKNGTTTAVQPSLSDPWPEFIRRGISTASQGPLGDGPFAPNNALAAQSRDLTQCRKCGWYNRFPHRNFRHHQKFHWSHRHNPLGSMDWCHSCGRIASDRDFAKVQSEPYTRTPGDVFLGTRVIPFRIVAHDPRQMEKYQARWASHEGTDPNWTYSEVEEEENMFKHRFGKYPRIEVILDSVPVVAPDKIPKTSSPTVSPDETEAIILNNAGDLTLLEELRNFGTVGGKKRDAYDIADEHVEGDIKAKWNREARSGVSNNIIAHMRRPIR